MASGPRIYRWTLLGLPVTDIEFPSVVICAPGFSSETLQAAFFSIVLDYLRRNNISTDNHTPIDLAKSRMNMLMDPVRWIAFEILIWSFLKTK